MGSGIAQVAATAGCYVKIYDSNQEALNKSKAALENTLSKLVEKTKIDDEEKSRIQNNISYAHTMGEVSHSYLVIEAIVENMHVWQHSLLSFIEMLFLLAGGMTLAYMTKLFVILFVQKPVPNEDSHEDQSGGRML